MCDAEERDTRRRPALVFASDSTALAGRANRKLDSYRRFIAGSRADLGNAKDAYVTSRSGWFSDRSTCFLASGRPALHQETGFTDWLPTTFCVLSFNSFDELEDAIHRMDTDYRRQAAAARQVAEEHFEAKTALGHMLDAAGLR